MQKIESSIPQLTNQSMTPQLRVQAETTIMRLRNGVREEFGLGSVQEAKLKVETIAHKRGCHLHNPN